MRMIFLTFIAIVATSISAAGDDNKWGAMAERFFLPLTYPDFDPKDFGVPQDPADAALARRFQPHIFIAPGGMRPIDFYTDYLPHTLLKDGAGAIVKRSPGRADLKRVERTHGMYLDYDGPGDLKGSPVAYVRVRRKTVTLATPERKAAVPFTFIKYNFAFQRSGLPMRIPFVRGVLARLAGDPEDWHELDIHGAIIVALVSTSDRLTPAALILAQHNHFRTYLIGRDVPVPPDGRPGVSFALRSNEPYPAPTGSEPVAHRAVGNPADFTYVITGKGFSLTSGIDLVFGTGAGAREVDYRLDQLPSRDPLYVAWIPLGDRRKLFGVVDTWYRDGPPGIDCFTWPEMKDFGKLMKFWFVDDGDEKAAALFNRDIIRYGDARFGPLLEYNGRRFAEEFFTLHPAIR